MANQKYMFVRHDPSSNTVYLGREGGGGACVVRTKQCIVIGVWNKAAIMSDKKPQTQGNCNMQVEAMGAYLTSAGY